MSDIEMSRQICLVIILAMISVACFWMRFK